MTWQEIDLAGKTWTLPAARAKNGRQHVIPLSEQALDVLRSLRLALTSAETAEVFPPLGFSQSKAKLDAAIPPVADLPPWTLHDLRRTCASGMARLGVAPHIIEACLNHQSGIIRGVAAVYNRCRYEPEKRAALDLWGAHVAALSARPVALAAAA
jgi:integrase